MSAEIEPAAWNAYCGECSEGAGPFGHEYDAEAWAVEHDAENHEDDDPDEIARQEWRDSRDD